METLERVISEHPFFADLAPPYANVITGCASNIRFEPGTYIFREGGQADVFYLIRSGRVGLEIFPPHRKPMLLGTVDAGEILGWSWLLPPYQWKFNARAMESIRAIALDGKCLRNKCEENHDLGYELLKRFAQVIEKRLESTRLQLLDVYAVA
jgi:CRP/FNR family transcriptional regulator, cyclic AMP receptor protein